MKTFTVKIGKGPDKMTFDECMVHIKRVLFWDNIDGEWCDVVPLSDRRWEELAGYIRGAHEREVDALKAENDKLRELARDLERARRALCFDTLYECDECAACSICDAKLAKPMQELGIEVE